MELFNSRTVTMPLDRACITAAWVDICKLRFGFHVVVDVKSWQSQKMNSPRSKPRSQLAPRILRSRKAHPEIILRQLPVMTYGLICYIILFGWWKSMAMSLYYGAAKHEMRWPQKVRWWWRLSLFLIDFVISIRHGFWTRSMTFLDFH
ncbi:hypothetical protein Ocin01_09023 [Orchesella cincta]|uniref:Uncharacterized protein n=1 Tax=Orchesella cincta TaxID=48709 RepID=A0A1D2MX80_ORCCI|nr:hypothetical protein Ocin01_09023 [Orchesella cincta]